MRSMLRSEMVSQWSKNQCNPVKRHLAIDGLIDVEGTCDRLVIGRMQAKRPAMGDQMPDDRLQFLLHHGRQLRARLKKILEVRRREDQHLAGTVHAVEVVTGTRVRHLRPALKVTQLLRGLLGKQVIGQPHRELTPLV